MFRRWFWRAFFGLLAVAFLCFAWAVGIEPGRLVVADHAVRAEGWPEELSGYRIAVLADLHIGSPHVGLDRLGEIVAETNAQTPDLILLAGDYVIDEVVGGTPVDITAIAPLLAGLKARDGVVAVLGNHDNWNDGPRIRAVLEANGIRVLEDESSAVVTTKGGFSLVGVSDYTTAPHDVAKAFNDVLGPVVVLTHSPDVFPELPNTVALGIAGHTHGGQVYVPLFGRPIVPSRYGQRYVMGLIEEGDATFFVGSGVGTSILPVRFMTPPEISVLTVSAR